MILDIVESLLAVILLQEVSVRIINDTTNEHTWPGHISAPILGAEILRKPRVVEFGCVNSKTKS